MSDNNRCETCDALPEEARPEMRGMVTMPTVPGPCPTCGAKPWCERHPSPPVEPGPGDFVISREDFMRAFNEGRVRFESIAVPPGDDA